MGVLRISRLLNTEGLFCRIWVSFVGLFCKRDLYYRVVIVGVLRIVLFVLEHSRKNNVCHPPYWAIWGLDIFRWRLGKRKKGKRKKRKKRQTKRIYKNITLLIRRIGYGVVTISRLLQDIGLFCKRALQNRPIFCKRDLYFLRSLLIVAPYLGGSGGSGSLGALVFLKEKVSAKSFRHFILE